MLGRNQGVFALRRLRQRLILGPKLLQQPFNPSMIGLASIHHVFLLGDRMHRLCIDILGALEPAVQLHGD